MSNGNIISYGFVDLKNSNNVKFSFPNLTSIPDYCKEPQNCKIN